MGKRTDKMIGPRILESTADFLRQKFETTNSGAEIVLEAFPNLYEQALSDLRGKFSMGELCLMIDVMNGLMLTPGQLGHILVADVEDGISLDGLDEKWKVDSEDMIARLRALPFFYICVLEVWSKVFWTSGIFEKEDGLDEWAGPLAKKEEPVDGKSEAVQ